jgi:2-polyprenyl-6-hydroxyphenyl methylase/3-demethylubiquinone-9 3-methyltransferase
MVDKNTSYSAHFVYGLSIDLLEYLMEAEKMKSHISPEIQIINNDIYDQLGERWYTAKDDPVALLRAEAKCRDPWVSQIIRLQVKHKKIEVLDIGCGGGFLSNRLAREGYQVTGVDLSEDSLEVARRYDSTHSVSYLSADAYSLPMDNGSFDVVCAMDFLEHVNDPARAIREMSRILKPGGLFFFHTFNRNPIANFVVIKLVEWLVKNTPPKMHVPELFIKPKELEQLCENYQLKVVEIRGLRPNIFSLAALKSLLSGSIDDGFSFSFVKSLLISYCGYARKESCGSQPASYKVV